MQQTGAREFSAHTIAYLAFLFLAFVGALHIHRNTRNAGKRGGIGRERKARGKRMQAIRNAHARTSHRNNAGKGMHTMNARESGSTASKESSGERKGITRGYHTAIH
jgi:hypothetical protein